MWVRDLTKSSFLPLDSNWSVDRSLILLDALKPSHVIIHHSGRNSYHLFRKSEVETILERENKRATLDEVLELATETITITRSVYDVVMGVIPEKAVVVDGKDVVGFIDNRPTARSISIGDKEDFSVPSMSSGDTEDFSVPSMSSGDTEDVSKEQLSAFYLSGEFPSETRLGDSVSLLAYISTINAEGKSLPFAVPENSKVDILVSPKEGFELDGPGEGSLRATKEKTLPLQFKLKAVREVLGEIHMYAFQNGQALGLIRLTSRIVPQETVPTGGRRTYQTDVTKPLPASPDLSLIILEGYTEGKPSLTFKVSAADPKLGLDLKQFGPKKLETDPHEHFSKFFKDIENLPLKTDDQKREAMRRLSAKGLDLFKTVIPEDLQVLLWSLKDTIKSVHIQSEEPWIPWEICMLQGLENGKIVDGEFLCEAFSVTRWIPGIGRKWPELTSKNLGLVVPSDSDLPYAQNEKRYLLSTKSPTRKVDPINARIHDLTEAFKKGEHDIWHFTGHGVFVDPNPDYSAILLEAGERLTPVDLSGSVKNLGMAHPLVFLNACHVGRSSMSLTDIGGMARKFIDANAAGFIGAYWSVYDKAAFEFAKIFYSRLFDGIPLGQAVRDARMAIKKLGDPTWLAYTAFAHPSSRMT